MDKQKAPLKSNMHQQITSTLNGQHKKPEVQCIENTNIAQVYHHLAMTYRYHKSENELKNTM